MDTIASHTTSEPDSGGDPTLRFSLTPSSASLFPPSNNREIFVRRQVWNDNNRILAVVERTLPEDSREAVRESERFLDTRQDLVLPLYALPSPSRDEWNIEIAYGRGALRVDYSFRTRDDAFRFQQLITNYVPVAQFDNITCLVTYKGLGFRRPQYAGVGQVQLWKQAEEKQQQNPGCRSLSPVSSSGSFGSTWTAVPRSPATIASSTSRPMSIASVQSGHSHTGSIATIQTYAEKNKSVLVTQDFHPPILVAFLKNKSNPEGFTMLKFKIADLTQSEFTNKRDEALLSLVSRSDPNFRVYKHLPAPDRDPLSAWNLCEPQKKGDKTLLVDQLDCSHLALNFGSHKDPANLDKREGLDRCMLELQMEYLEKLAGQTATRDEGIAVMSQEMRAPLRPVSTTSSTVPRLSSIHEPPELLPEISRHSTIGTDFIARAGTADSSRSAISRISGLNFQPGFL